VEDRALPGHWEGDLLFGSKNSQIATLVERQSRYVMLAKVGKKDTETVVNALIKHAHKLPHELYRTLTWDRGKEMADHRRFTLATDIKVYFCDPRSPWQRGSNENANGAIEAISTQGAGPLRVFAIQTQCDRAAPQRTTAQDAGLRIQRNDFMRLLRRR